MTPGTSSPVVRARVRVKRRKISRRFPSCTNPCIVFFAWAALMMAEPEPPPPPTIRVLSAEGEETIWPRAAAAEQATALKDWIDSAADDGGAFATPVPAQALRALAAFAEQCATAAASGGDAARDAAASAWAAEKERSPAELAQLLHGAHFLEMPNARLAIGREFCARLAATGSPDELAAMLEAACDLSDEERQAALTESIFEPEGPNDVAQPPAAPQPPALQRTVSSQLVNEDAIEEALAEADVPTLRKLKGVNRSWRARARRVLCRRLFAAKGRPMPACRADVTDIEIAPFLKADGPGVAHVIEAMTRFPNLARMHAQRVGFVSPSGLLADSSTLIRGLDPRRTPLTQFHIER